MTALAISFAAGNTALNAYFGIACPLRSHTGIQCPLCGGTRAMLALAQGRVEAGVKYNALVAFLPLMAIAILAFRKLGVPHVESLIQRARRHDMACFLVVAGAWTLARNLL